jgi:Tetratricopeptide repeat
VQVDTTDEANAPLVERFRQMWTPDMRVLGPDGFEYDAWQGYWPPAELTARLLLGRARALARQNRNQDAETVYGEVLRRFPRSYAAPEAAYWRAVCRYKRTHRPDDLIGGWKRTLQTRYPDSQWRTAQAWSEPPLKELPLTIRACPSGPGHVSAVRAAMTTQIAHIFDKDSSVTH